LSNHAGSVDEESCSIPDVQIPDRLDVTRSSYRQGVEVVISKEDRTNSEVANPELVDKLNLLRQAINRLNLPFRDKRHVEYFPTGLLLRWEANISRHYRKSLRAAKDDTIKTSPAYSIRIQDGVFYLTVETITKAYNILGLNSLPSKTNETAFQTLNEQSG
jgi:hypothetical protein